VVRPDQRELAAGAGDGSVIVWDLTSGSHRAQAGHTQPVTCVAYNHAGDLLATGSQDSTILIRDAKTLEPKLAPLKANGRINRLVFSPDGKYLAAATGENIATPSSDGAMRRQFAAKLWEAASGTLVRDFMDHKREVTGVAFSANGESLATSSADGRLRIWDLRNLHAVPAAKELSHEHDASFGGDEDVWMANNAFSAVTFAGDGRLVSALSVQNYAEVWDIKGGKPQYRLLGHEGGIRSLAFSGAGGKHKLATVGADHKIRLYYLETPDLVARAKLLLKASQAGPLGSR
jgi:WD40 repeat protein